MSEAPAKEAEATEEKPKKSKKKLLIGGGLALLIAGAGVPMFLMGGKPEEAPVETEAVHEEIKVLETADLGSYVVNLSEATSFLKVHMIVEYDAAIVERQMKHEGVAGEKKEEKKEEKEGKEKAGPAPLPEFMAKRETQVKDVTLKVLSSKHAEDVLTVEGKERLKDELIEGLNEAVALEEPPVVSVFFTGFIVQ